MNTAAALSPPVEPDVKRPSRRRVGICCLIICESALFIIFVIAYLFYIGKSLTGPYPAQVLDRPWLASICLLSSSVTVILGERAMVRGSKHSFHLWILVTILLGLAFLGFTAQEWYDLIFNKGLSINTNLFGTTFYSLVGLHATHVTIGLILLSLVLVLSLLGYIDHTQHERVEALSWYWHFVDGVWIVVFTVVYLVGM